MSLPTIIMPTYTTPRRATRTRSATLLSKQQQQQQQQPSPTVLFGDDPRWKLLVTADSKICTWDRSGCEPIFTSSSRGIVTAKRAQDGSALAIADAQVVMLHQMKDGQDKSYRLRGTQRCHLLQFSPDSRHLFYTDSLHNSVQSYSLSENRVVDAARSHPSPVTAFAVSCDSNLVLSASASPPTVQIYNQVTRTTTFLAPSASSAPVVFCAFHPSRKQLFLLAFGDGVLAAFDYAKLPITKTHKKENTGFGIVRCHARGIHAFRHLHDPSIAGSAGIVDAGFVPGHRSRAVTAGEDGRCFLVDFEMGNTIGSWHIGAPATGLAIRDIAEGPSGRKEELGGYLIAVGTVSGKCLVYDGSGSKIAERVINADAERVLDVEWVFGDVSLPEGDTLALPDPVSAPSSPRKTSAAERSARASRSRIRSDKPVNALAARDPDPTAPLPAAVEHAGGSSVADPELTPARSRNRAFSPPMHGSLDEAADQGYMNLFSPVRRKRAFTSASLPAKTVEDANKPPGPRIRATQQGSGHRNAISAPLPEGGPPGSKGQDDPPAVPVAGGFGPPRTDTRRETTTLHSRDGPVSGGLCNAPGERIKGEDRIDDGRILSEIKSIRAACSGKSKGGSDNVPLLAPYLPVKARSTPASRAGAAPNADPSIGRAVSVPEGKVHTSSSACPLNDMQRTAKSDNQSAAATARNTLEETEVEERQEASPVHGEPEEIPTEEDDEDIWLAQTTRSRSSRSSRKRKKVLEEETIVDSPFPQVGIDLSRSVSTTRSSKSRKTVSWSDEALPLCDTAPTMDSSSLMAEWGDGDGSASAQSYLGSTRPLSLAPHHRASNARAFSATTASSGTALGEKKATSQDSVQTIGGIVKTVLADMQAAMLRQMNVMQVEMQRQFREQNHELQGLKTEMGRVREENQKLRSMLFRSSGVRDSVRRTGDPGTPR